LDWVMMVETLRWVRLAVLMAPVLLALATPV